MRTPHPKIAATYLSGRTTALCGDHESKRKGRPIKRSRVVVVAAAAAAAASAAAAVQRDRETESCL